ncbi:hypothetical protein [Pseudobacteroides cellulosolvens]|nr:hypothetical protein [Pseudobacteroides cellulosolvens]
MNQNPEQRARDIIDKWFKRLGTVLFGQRGEIYKNWEFNQSWY